ncbi:cytochrome c oxidase subunit 2 [Paenibacillus shirakamiensis]|uniref:Cytochrome c oxidase subunit 2 n=1 Tax=Paenibacillus shirakamiensis TaxID=1265935 RepID=A0ABS4JIP1_9BACL|nr:cupredoxin domain-containing protein [Paenibacillus shirakamiensis]MBP2000474.1 cytochrome c oxidase subunit 2 [Paenibacillus shirakamiensis]
MRKITTLMLSMLLIFLLAACGSSKSGSATTDSNVVPQYEVNISATNYAFDKKEYRLKKGVPVKLIFNNVKGNHSALIPQLNVQLDASHTSAVVTPKEAGEFEMACSIMCGTGHSQMITKIIVE